MSSHNHVSKVDLERLSKGIVVEIGSSREENTSESSTEFFNTLCKKLNLPFYSVDFSPQSHQIAQSIVGKSAILMDGKLFLESMESLTGASKIAILYLDNFDVVYNSTHLASLSQRIGDAYERNGEILTNERSAVVHFEQLEVALPRMSELSIIVIDDTLQKADSPNGWWGKGAYCVDFLLKSGWKLLISDNNGVLFTSPELSLMYPHAECAK